MPVSTSRKKLATEIAETCGLPEAVREPAKKSSLPDDDSPIWGVPAIAAAIGRPVQGTYYLLRCGDIPAAKIGGQWCTTRRRLRDCFNGVSAGV